MKFKELLLNSEKQYKHKPVQKFEKKVFVQKSLISEEVKTPERILRDAGFKIKLVTPTAFGTQIDFAKKYQNEEVEKVLKDFNIKIKNNSVFIIE